MARHRWSATGIQIGIRSGDVVDADPRVAVQEIHELAVGVDVAAIADSHAARVVRRIRVEIELAAAKDAERLDRSQCKPRGRSGLVRAGAEPEIVDLEAWRDVPRARTESGDAAALLVDRHLRHAAGQ